MTPEGFTSCRERLGFTRAALSRALGCAPNTITAYEKGRKRIPRYIALAVAALLYGLPPAK